MTPPGNCRGFCRTAAVDSTSDLFIAETFLNVIREVNHATGASPRWRAMDSRASRQRRGRKDACGQIWAFAVRSFGGRSTARRATRCDASPQALLLAVGVERHAEPIASVVAFVEASGELARQ